MPIQIECQGCGQQYRVPEALVGKQANCKKCGGVIHIAAPSSDDEKLKLEPLSGSPSASPSQSPSPAPVGGKNHQLGDSLGDLLDDGWGGAPASSHVLSELPSARESASKFALPLNWLIVAGAGGTAVLLVAVALAVVIFSGGPEVAVQDESLSPPSELSESPLLNDAAKFKRKKEQQANGAEEKASASRDRPTSDDVVADETQPTSETVAKEAAARAAWPKVTSSYFPVDPEQWINSSPIPDEMIKGKAAFVYFFEETCPRCEGRWTPMQKLLKENAESDPIILIAVNSGTSREVLEEYVRRNKITWPVIVDSDRSMEPRFNVRKIGLRNIIQLRYLTGRGRYFPSIPLSTGQASSVPCRAPAGNTIP